MHKYGAWIEKSMYGRKYMGTARVTYIIDEKGVIEEVIGKVDTANHKDEVLKMLKTLQEVTKELKALVPLIPDAK